MTSVHDPWAIVVHYQNFPLVMRTLEDVVLHGITADKIVFVDNGGDVHAQGVIGTAFPGIHVMGAQGNVGYAAAVNMGVFYAHQRGATHALVLTHEVRLGDDLLRELILAFREDATVAVSAPLIYRLSDPELLWSAGGDLKLADCYPRSRGSWSARPVDWVDGCCFLVEVAAFREIGGLYEPYFLYMEEVDFFYRLRLSGRFIRVVSTAMALQEPGNMGLYRATRNRILLAKRLAPRHVYWRIVASHAARLVAECILRPRKGRAKIRERARGLSEGVRVRAFERPDEQQWDGLLT